MSLEVTPKVLKITIDGVENEVVSGSMILDAILAQEIDIPHLCKSDSQGPLGACRTCLVEIAGSSRLVAACHTPVTDGMEVSTDSERTNRIRRGVLDLTIGMSADGRGQGQAALYANSHGLSSSTYVPNPRSSKDESNVFFSLDMNDCILCGRCVDACQNTQHIGAIGINGLGENAQIGSAFNASWRDSNCTSCGQCVSECPTGALLPKTLIGSASSHRMGRDTDIVSTTCPYCGVGCGLLVHRAEERIVWVDGEPNNQSSLGMTCVKGRFGLDFVHSEDRLTTPLIRRNGRLESASWDEALQLIAEKFVEARGSFASIASAKATNEDGYIQQKFVRAVMQTNSIDHCSRLCHAPSVVALMEQVGSGATSNSYLDYEQAGTLLVVGSDTSQNHPVIASRLRKAVQENDAALIVINPIEIELCEVATVHLQPRPGTDVALLNAMANVILEENLEDQIFISQRMEGFEEWRETVQQISPEDAEKICGVPAEDIRRAARLFADPPLSQNGNPRGSCTIWGMGVTQHTMGSDNARALINLALLCGQVGGIGNGISPLRGQNNVQGCSDVGCLPNVFPGYEAVDTVESHDRWSAAWNTELTFEKGLQSTTMIESMLKGTIDTMYVVGENPLLSDPFLAHATEAFKNLSFLVVQDIFMHETAEIADVVLPAAAFAEKDGTFTNSERRVQLVRKIVNPPGEARDDWKIISELARRVLTILGRPDQGFSHESASDIFDEMSSLMPIIGGLSHERLDREGGIQWPCPDVDHPGTPRLFTEEFPRGRGKFVGVQQGPPAAELPSKRFPFTLITGRTLYHWHGGVITRRVKGLVDMVPVVTVDINIDDAIQLNLHDGDDVQLASRRGEIIAQVKTGKRQRRGELFVPFVQLEGVAANFLTNDELDTLAGIPEYKACAVRIESPGTPTRRGKKRSLKNHF